jgi:hypothetical protein
MEQSLERVLVIPLETVHAHGQDGHGGTGN